MLTKFLKRFPPALSGLWYGISRDRSFSGQLFGGILIIAGVYKVAAPISETAVFFLFLSWALILITELQNSAIEAALDQLHPERHEAIKRSKDMAAGAVLLAGIFFMIVVATILWNAR